MSDKEKTWQMAIAYAASQLKPGLTPEEFYDELKRLDKEFQQILKSKAENAVERFKKLTR